MPSRSSALWKPRFDITVVTMVFLANSPFCDKCLPMMYITLSPSTISPFSSTAMRRSLSPSKARPIAEPVSLTKACNCSGCVEPTPALMLRPSGWSPMTAISAFKSRKILRADTAAAPLAASKATFMPPRSTPVATKNFSYLRRPSG